VDGRLMKEYRSEHKIYAVDFDGTLSFGECPNVGPANVELITFLKEKQRQGDKLILWTCREEEALQRAVQWCEQLGLIFDAVNDNIPEIVNHYGNNSRKISCDYYIDDKMLLIEYMKYSTGVV